MYKDETCLHLLANGKKLDATVRSERIKLIRAVGVLNVDDAESNMQCECTCLDL